MICKRCGEHWHLDSIHDILKEEYPSLKEDLVTEDGKWDQERYEREFFNPKRKKFLREGCEVVDPGARGDYCFADEETESRSNLLAEIAIICGDDADAMESDIADATSLGLL